MCRDTLRIYRGGAIFEKGCKIGQVAAFSSSENFQKERLQLLSLFGPQPEMVVDHCTHGRGVCFKHKRQPEADQWVLTLITLNENSGWETAFWTVLWGGGRWIALC